MFTDRALGAENKWRLTILSSPKSVSFFAYDDYFCFVNSSNSYLIIPKSLQMLFKRFPTFWASSSYASVLDKTDVVVAYFSVKMVRTDGQTTFHSHSDISEVVFNYNHPAVVDFRLILNRLSAAHLTQDNQIPGWSRHEFESSAFAYKTKLKMRKKRCEDSSQNQDEGRGKRTCARGSDENITRSFTSFTANSVNPVTMNFGSSITENENQSPQSTIMNPLSDRTTGSVLSDITNRTRKSNLIEISCSGITSVNSKSNVPDVNRLTRSVNQKKVQQRSLSTISQVATNLTIRLDQPYDTSKYVL
ncbi:hypothetical protein K1719_000033 [Acacia pycnantha]|nr:hypothetical protein K1719_000033 [Acacia pycnantha]